MYEPACGNDEPHEWHQHTTMNLHFKQLTVWCGGVCDCGCTCADHMGKPHGPGDHK